MVSRTNILNYNTLRFCLLYSLALSVAGIDLSITVRSGQALTHSSLGGTAAYVMIGLGTIAAARIGMPLMHRMGVRVTYLISAGLCVLSGVLTAFSSWRGVPITFYMGLVFIGMFMGFANYHRLLVKDLSQSASPWDTSLVLLSGVVGAVLGPWLAGILAPEVEVFYRAYLVVVGLGVTSAVAAFTLPMQVRSRDERTLSRDGFDRWGLCLGGIIGLCSYAAMTLVMTAVPLAAKQVDMSSGEISSLSQAHMVAMYLPIVMVAALIVRFSARAVAGVALGSGALALLIVQVSTGGEITYAALMGFMLIAGVLWACGYSAASNMVADSAYGQRNPRVRGRIEVLPPVGMIIGSVAAGLFLDGAGFSWVVWAALGFCVVAMPFVVAKAP